MEIGALFQATMASAKRGTINEAELRDTRLFFAGEVQAQLYLEGLLEATYRCTIEEPLSAAYTAWLASEAACRELRQAGALVDMGPGDGVRTRILAEGLRRLRDNARYLAVDINEVFLRLGVSVARATGLQVCDMVVADFSEIAPELSRLRRNLAKGECLVFNFGTTALNYSPRALVRLSARILRRGDLIVVSLLEPMSGWRLGTADVAPYLAPEHELLSFAGLSEIADFGRLIGSLSYRPRWAGSAVEVGFDFTPTVHSLVAASARRTSRFTVLRSYRYPLEVYVGLLEPHFELLNCEPVASYAKTLCLMWKGSR